MHELGPLRSGWNGSRLRLWLSILLQRAPVEPCHDLGGNQAQQQSRDDLVHPEVLAQHGGDARPEGASHDGRSYGDDESQPDRQVKIERGDRGADTADQELPRLPDVEESASDRDDP